MFYIYNKNKKLIYIDYSKDIKNKVVKLFTSKKFIPKYVQNNFKSIKVHSTGNYSISIIKTLNEIKKLNPKINNNIDPKIFQKTDKPIIIAELKDFIITFNGKKESDKSFIFFKNEELVGYGYFNLFNNINNQRAVLKEFLRLRGDNQEDIEETIQDYEDLGKLERQAERAQERLASYYEHQKEQLAQRQQQENVQREQKRREVLETIENTVSSSEEIKGFPMTRKAKKDLLSYMTETSVKIDGPNGPQYVTKFQADEMEAGKDVNDFILRAYLRMTDFNLDKVKKKTTSDFSSKLKTQLQNSKSRTDTKAKFGGNKKTGAATKSDAWTL